MCAMLWREGRPAMGPPQKEPVRGPADREHGVHRRIGRAGGLPPPGRHHHPPRARGRRQFVPAHPHLVPDRDGPAQAHERGGDGDRPPDRAEKGQIEQAYRGAEAAGVAVCCQDEAGPYQTVPYPGENWQPAGHPARQPHEYQREGTAKLLTLFRPATGQVWAKGVTHAPNAVLHPWLQAELTQVLTALPAVTTSEGERPALARWESWLGRPPRAPLPPLRLILIWDNLPGHLTPCVVEWTSRIPGICRRTQRGSQRSQHNGRTRGTR